MRVVIIGASGGIGGALTERLSLKQDVQRIHALSRAGVTVPAGKVETSHIDLSDERTIEAAAQNVASQGLPDIVIVATGILSVEDSLQPEKSYRHQSPEAFERVFTINTFGPALVAKHFLPIMPKQGRAVFAALSARVGSISDNRLGGWHAYRASKAALNMLIRNYAIEQGRRNDAFIAVGLHPGTVDTDLSKPFQSNVPDKQLFSPEQSAEHLIKVIEGLKPADTGKVFDWAGKEIPV